MHSVEASRKFAEGQKQQLHYSCSYRSTQCIDAFIPLLACCKRNSSWSMPAMSGTI